MVDKSKFSRVISYNLVSFHREPEGLVTSILKTARCLEAYETALSFLTVPFGKWFYRYRHPNNAENLLLEK